MSTTTTTATTTTIEANNQKGENNAISPTTITNKNSSSTFKLPLQSHPCHICHKSISLYRCPRCFIRTCSLSCCKAHKVQQNCNGKRNKTQYVPLYKYNDGNLKSDYYFLEDVLTCTKNGERILKDVLGEHQAKKRDYGAGAVGGKRVLVNEDAGHGDDEKEEKEEEEEPQPALLSAAAWDKQTAMTAGIKRKRLNDDDNEIDITDDDDDDDQNEEKTKQQKLSILKNNATSHRHKVLLQQCLNRNITLLLMPHGMSRHADNTSTFVVKQDVIKWRIEWIFYNPSSSLPEKSLVLHSQRVSEKMTWREALKYHLEKSNKHSSKYYTALRPFRHGFELIKKKQTQMKIANEETTQKQSTNSSVTATTAPLTKAPSSTENEMTDKPSTNTTITISTTKPKSEIQLLMKKLPSQASHPKYTSLKVNSTIQDALYGMTIVEFPSIYVVFSKDVKTNFPLLVEEIET